MLRYFGNRQTQNGGNTGGHSFQLLLDFITPSPVGGVLCLLSVLNLLFKNTM